MAAGAQTSPGYDLYLGDRRVDLPAPDPGDPAVPPGRPGAGAADDLHLRVPQHHGPHRRPAVEPEEQGAALRSAVLGDSSIRRPCRLQGPADQPGSGACGPTCSTRTPSTGTGSATSSRSSTVSRPARSRCRPGAISPTSTCRTTPARTCTTATSRTPSTSTWA